MKYLIKGEMIGFRDKRLHWLLTFYDDETGEISREKISERYEE